MPSLNTYNLPDDLITGPSVDKNEVIIRHYKSGHDSIKNKIILSRNMINLVISGSKTVIYPETTITVQNGELVVLSTGNMLTSEIISNKRDFESMLIYFSNDLLNNFWIKYQSMPPGTAPTNKKQPYLIYPQDGFIRQYVQSLQVYYKAHLVCLPRSNKSN